MVLEGWELGRLHDFGLDEEAAYGCVVVQVEGSKSFTLHGELGLAQDSSLLHHSSLVDHRVVRAEHSGWTEVSDVLWL